MHTIKEVLSAVRREIDAALAEDPLHPGRPCLGADRIVLTLGLSFCQGPSDDESLQVGVEIPNSRRAASSPTRSHRASSPVHTLTLELSPVATVPGVARSTAREIPRPTDVPANATESLTRSLSLVLGAPGFDSSARASVLRETLDGLTDAQVSATIKALDQATPPEGDKAVTAAWQWLKRILRVCPAKPPATGARILQEVFSRHPARLVLGVIEERWKSQTDWLGEAKSG
ncbi:MAG: hypothetical protein ACYC23_19575 [Limisphaerales bacterium]